MMEEPYSVSFKDDSKNTFKLAICGKNRLIKLAYFITLFLLIVVNSTNAQLSVSENGRYLARHDGTPFLWLGDTGWGLFQKLSHKDIDFYFKTRAEQGFSVVHAAVVHKNPFIVPELENIYGDKAFADETLMLPAVTDGKDNNDQADYDYWDHVDYVVDKADKYGLYLVFVPLFNMAEGDGYNLINVENAYGYGKFLGKRYKDKTNIIWCMGGDVLAENDQSKTIWNLLAKGITESIAGKEDYSKTLMTYHVRGGHSSSDYFGNAPWIDFHMIQTWDSYTTIYDMVAKDYNNKLVKPVLHGEGAYEDGPEYPTKPITSHKIRKQAYWATFAGGMHTYGNTNIWSFGSNLKYVKQDWKEAIYSDGAKSMSVYHQIFQSLNWWDFSPDQSIIAEGTGTGDSLNVAMNSVKTNQILVYLSEPSEVSLDLNKLSGSTKLPGEWINPKTGERKSAGKFSKNKDVKVKTPLGWEDALLLIGDR
ncbi:apiosidase-like domain-containing protein [Maribellus mangrovi]|uniref:apiosidase-like domain-containing protein n=1 Tax=Maribellus mangrovi TaxID=3133146 RepID=UPI0030EC7424